MRIPFLAAVALLSVPSWAQQPISRVVTTVVKPDRVADFEAAVKQYNEVYSKITGARARAMFQSMTGPNRFRRAISYEKWGDLDRGPGAEAFIGNAELARINARIQSCVQSSTTEIEVLLPDLSLPRPSDAPKLVVVSRSRIRPDKIAEYTVIVKDELMPALKKGGAKSFSVRRVRFGAPTNEFYTSMRVDNWAEAGGTNIARSAMGEDAYQTMVSKLTALTLAREQDVFRYRGDLSYAPASGGGSTSTSATQR
jgi:hypothetical protein